MFLGPLCGAEQPPLFSIPRCDDDGPARLPSLLQQLTERSSRLHQRDVAARRIRCAIDPRVVMITLDDPLVGKLTPLNAGDDVVEGPYLPVKRELEVNFCRTGTDVIGQRQ